MRLNVVYDSVDVAAASRKIIRISFLVCICLTLSTQNIIPARTFCIHFYLRLVRTYTPFYKLYATVSVVVKLECGSCLELLQLSSRRQVQERLSQPSRSISYQKT